MSSRSAAEVAVLKKRHKDHTPEERRIYNSMKIREHRKRLQATAKIMNAPLLAKMRREEEEVKNMRLRDMNKEQKRAYGRLCNRRRLERMTLAEKKEKSKKEIERQLARGRAKRNEKRENYRKARVARIMSFRAENKE